MKKIFTTIFMACALLTANAALTLTVQTVDENDEYVLTYITKDTTLVITDFEEDVFSGEVLMEARGYVSSESSTMNVYIERSTLGMADQFCLGSCINGNEELSQTLEGLAMMSGDNLWFVHYYPKTVGTETIAYTFNDGINPAIKLTIEYVYQATGVDNITQSTTINAIYNLLGQRMPTQDINELPAGIYIINGKKHIKQ